MEHSKHAGNQSTSQETTPESIQLPKHHFYPPIWNIQRVLATRHNQFKAWSTTILFYCRTLKIWRLNIIEHLSSPLFHNKQLKKHMRLEEVQQILDWMVSEDGGKRAEWVDATTAGSSTGKNAAWIYWRQPEEWAEIIWQWIEETGQKGTVVTLYEITWGEATLRQDFHGMDPEILQKALQHLVKRGKAQVFGSSGEQGVKFF